MLTPAQREARRGRLTASRVACLMRGKPDDLHRLWLEMTGQAEEEDLSRVWQIQVGEATEQRHLNWIETARAIIDELQRCGVMPADGRAHIIRRGEVVVHSMHDQFACTLDGYIDELMIPVEVKHVSGKEPIEVVIERYQPQLHFQMCCMNTQRCAISIARCLDDPVVEFIHLDHDYAGEMLRRGIQFMEFVRKRVPPVALPAVPPPVSKWIDYNMTGNATWRRFADQWLQTRGAVEACTEAEKTLKSLVPDDARKAFGNGVRITRDRANRLSLRTDS